MTWFKLGGDSRLGACATDRCGGQTTWRLEADGVGSNYCSGCKEKIERTSVSRHNEFNPEREYPGSYGSVSNGTREGAT